MLSGLQRRFGSAKLAEENPARTPLIYKEAKKSRNVRDESDFFLGGPANSFQVRRQGLTIRSKGADDRIFECPMFVAMWEFGTRSILWTL